MAEVVRWTLLGASVYKHEGVYLNDTQSMLEVVQLLKAYFEF
jgi:hypothetical protein